MNKAIGKSQYLPFNGGNDGQPPRDAATLLIVDDSEGAVKVLMGRRRLDQIFMPGKFVFPGGRVDASDSEVESADELAEKEVLKLLHDMKRHPSRLKARAIALAGIREVFEETGMIIGKKINAKENTISQPPAWQDFFDAGYQPALSRLRFFARAITPPGRSRRYDTRFFYLPAHQISVNTGNLDGELSEIGWYTIAKIAQLDLPPITRLILEDLCNQLNMQSLGSSHHSQLCYYPHGAMMQRQVIDFSNPLG